MVNLPPKVAFPFADTVIVPLLSTSPNFATFNLTDLLSALVSLPLTDKIPVLETAPVFFNAPSNVTLEPLFRVIVPALSTSLAKVAFVSLPSSAAATVIVLSSAFVIFPDKITSAFLATVKVPLLVKPPTPLTVMLALSSNVIVPALATLSANVPFDLNVKLSPVAILSRAIFASFSKVILPSSTFAFGF